MRVIPVWAEEFSDYKIGAITVTRSNVFDLTDPEQNTDIGKWGNRLHRITQENIVLQELLFKTGDIFDIELVRESERNLRKYDFLTNIEIIPIINRQSKTVDIFVETADQWSLIVGASFGGTTDEAEWGIDIGEKNFLGRGQSLNYNLRHTGNNFSHSIGFKDQTWLNSRYAVDLSHQNDSIEKVYKVKLDKPFYSLDSKKTQGVNYLRKDHSDQDISYNLYRAGIFGGHSFKYHSNNVLRLILRFSFGEQEVKKKMKRDNKILGEAALLINPLEYKKETYIKKFRQVEDISLGTKITLYAGPSLEFFGSTSSDISATLEIERILQIGVKDYLFSYIAIKKNDDEFNEEYADLDLQYFFRRFKRQTFVFHTRISYSKSAISQFKLGGTKGLRGYNNDSFQGKNQLVFNLEDRIYTYTAMLSGIIEPGFVLFMDIGNTWNDKPGDRLKELHGSFGAGIRIALLKAPGISLIRVDYGQQFDLKQAPVITIGMEGFF